VPLRRIPGCFARRISRVAPVPRRPGDQLGEVRTPSSMGSTTTSLPLSSEESGHRVERFSFSGFICTELAL
jgi:hypothetical protein